MPSARGTFLADVFPFTRGTDTEASSSGPFVLTADHGAGSFGQAYLREYQSRAPRGAHFQQGVEDSNRLIFRQGLPRPSLLACGLLAAAPTHVRRAAEFCTLAVASDGAAHLWLHVRHLQAQLLARVLDIQAALASFVCTKGLHRAASSSLWSWSRSSGHGLTAAWQK